MFFFTRAEGAELKLGLRCFVLVFFSFIFGVTFNMQASLHIHECEISLSCVPETKMADEVRILVDCSF